MNRTRKKSNAKRKPVWPISSIRIRMFSGLNFQGFRISKVVEGKGSRCEIWRSHRHPRGTECWKITKVAWIVRNRRYIDSIKARKDNVEFLNACLTLRGRVGNQIGIRMTDSAVVAPVRQDPSMNTKATAKDKLSVILRRIRRMISFLIC